VSRVIETIGVVVVVVGISCSRDTAPLQDNHVPQSQPVVAVREVKLEASPVVAQHEESLLTPFANDLPEGWRELRFGMSEAQVKGLILKYQLKKREWEQSQTTRLPIVHLERKQLSEVSVDEKQFHHWYAWDLDDGAKFPHAYFDYGKLVAFRHEGKIGFEEFLLKATEAYGVPPKIVEFSHFNGSKTLNRQFALWRGPRSTVLIWEESGAPYFLAWENKAMEVQAAVYQAGLDALSNGEKNGQRAKEKGTSF
jgi:hypothetical protein